MAKFYFHVRRGNVVYVDPEGSEVGDLKAAWGHALKDAQLLLGGLPREPKEEHWIDIEDEDGNTISTPPIGTAFH